MLVSIIIPCYNAASYLSRALDSALGQTYSAIEIICVDNNSTDETLALLKNYKWRFPTKIQVYEERIQGAPAARNLGLRYAKGEWVQFLDADDKLLPEKINSQVAFLRKASDVAVVVGACELVAPSGTVSYSHPTILNPVVALFLSELGNTLANLWNRQAVQAVGGWNQAYLACQEYELLSKLLLAEYKVVISDEVLCVAYQRHHSISYQSENYYHYNYKLRAFWYEKIKSSEAYDDHLELIEQRFFNIIKMYGKADRIAALRAFQYYFPDLQKIKNFQGEGLFYYVAKYFGYKIALSGLYAMYRFKS